MCLVIGVHAPQQRRDRRRRAQRFREISIATGMHVARPVAVFAYWSRTPSDVAAALGVTLDGLSTVDAAAPGQAPESYAVFAARVRVTVSQGDRFVYDPTADSVTTLYDPADPEYTPDADPGKPVELFGVGYRGGPDAQHAWAAVSSATTTAYCETCPFFGGPPVAQPAEGCRATFPATFDGAGVATAS